MEEVTGRLLLEVMSFVIISVKTYWKSFITAIILLSTTFTVDFTVLVKARSY